jgi:hypothetical protein
VVGMNDEARLASVFQQLIAAGLNEVLFLRRERVPSVQQGVNVFAGVDETQDLFLYRKHGGLSLPAYRLWVYLAWRIDSA